MSTLSSARNALQSPDNGKWECLVCGKEATHGAAWVGTSLLVVCKACAVYGNLLASLLADASLDGAQPTDFGEVLNRANRALAHFQTEYWRAFAIRLAQVLLRPERPGTIA